MRERLFIQKSCKVVDNAIYLNGEQLWKTDSELNFADFAKEAFHQLQLDYPKFYKMDNLSKLAFLVAEYLLQGEDKDDLALVLANNSGSLDTDTKYQETIQDPEQFFPSPATFVYTLANICEGELCIRHKLLTENIFLVAENFPMKTVQEYTDYLIVSEKAKRVLCGWVEFFKGNYKGVLYLVGVNEGIAHTERNIEELL